MLIACNTDLENEYESGIEYEATRIKGDSILVIAEDGNEKYANKLHFDLIDEQITELTVN